MEVSDPSGITVVGAAGEISEASYKKNQGKVKKNCQFMIIQMINH
jgi:hypothetical protein